MTRNKIILREFAYFDRQKIEDFISSIDDGLIRERKETTREIDAGLKAKIGIPGVAEVGGDLGSKGSEIEELKSSTDASLFQRLYTYFTSKTIITSIKEINKELWDKIENGDIIEIFGEVELSTMENVIDLLKIMMPFMKNQGTTKKPQKGIQLMEIMSSSQVGVNIRISLKNRSYKFVASLPTEKIRVTKQELNSAYTVLCRVQRKLNPGEYFDLFSLIPGLKLPRKQLRTLVTSFPPEAQQLIGKPITMEDFRISHPAMIVTPIAIYR